VTTGAPRNSKNAISWWRALIDTLLVMLISSAMAGVVALCAMQDFRTGPFYGLSGGNGPLAYSSIAWFIWPAIEAWLLWRWLYWKDCQRQMLPLGRSVLSPVMTCGVVILALGALLGLDYVLFDFDRDGLAAGGADFSFYMQSPLAPLMLLSAVFAAPAAEELMFRGFLQSAFAQTRLGFWVASIPVSVLWTATHGYGWLESLNIFCTGMVLTLVLRMTGTLVPGMIVHGAYNLIVLADFIAPVE
jgi:membrane protease YdiL (CAAX protease family)